MNRSSSSSSALSWVLGITAAVGVCVLISTATSKKAMKDLLGLNRVKFAISKGPQKETNDADSEPLHDLDKGEVLKSGCDGSEAEDPLRSFRFLREILHRPTRLEDHAMYFPTIALTEDQADQRLREEAVIILLLVAPKKPIGRCDSMTFGSHIICEAYQDIALSLGVGDAPTIYAGIFDGHSGPMTAAVLKAMLIPYVSWHLSALSRSSEEATITRAIQDAFLKLDARIMDNAEGFAKMDTAQCSPEIHRVMAPAMTGSGALVAAYDTNTSMLRVALTGDARAVIGRWCPETMTYTGDALTEDQNGFNAEEIKRLDKEHPGEIDRILDRETGKLMGSCVTRSFGDHRWKWPGSLVQSVAERTFGFERLKGDFPTPPYLTALPEVTTRKVGKKDFLILASGGLWNHMSPQTAVHCVTRWLAARRLSMPEEVKEVDVVFPPVGPHSYPSWGAAPQYFAIEDLDNAAVCLAKNALGGSRRTMFRGMMSLMPPFSMLAREDLSIQVIFFEQTHLTAGPRELVDLTWH